MLILSDSESNSPPRTNFPAFLAAGFRFFYVVLLTHLLLFTLLSCNTEGHNPIALTGVAGKKADTVILLTPAVPTIYWYAGDEIGGTWTEEGDTLRSNFTWTVFNGDTRFLVRADSVWITEEGKEPYLSGESHLRSQAMFRFYAESNRCGVSSELISEESQTLVYRGDVALVDSTEFPRYELDSMCPVAEVRNDSLFYVSHDETYGLEGFYQYRDQYYYLPANVARMAGYPRIPNSMEVRTQGAYCETCCWDIGPGEEGCRTERSSGTSSVSAAPSTSNSSGTSNPPDTSNPPETSNPPGPVLTGVRLGFFGSNEPRRCFMQLSMEPADAQYGAISFKTDHSGRISFTTQIGENLFFKFSCADSYTGDVTITATVDGSDDSEYEASLVFTCQ